MAEVKEELPNVKGNEEARETLKHSIIKRQASLSEAEHFFLHALLIDEPAPSEGVVEPDSIEHKQKLVTVAKVLDDDTLFSAMPVDKLLQESTERAAAAKKPRRRSNLGLWLAHESGVAPQSLVKRGGLDLKPSRDFAQQLDGEEKKEQTEETTTATDDASEALSDVEVRPDGSSCSSWEEENRQESFDTWKVLKDEYAEDFGFDYSTKGSSVDDVLGDSEQNSFKILGTSADDGSAQPHVLSPPLMDSLTNFLPDSVLGENFWLRFSLARDGAALDTLKQYVRASEYTIIAIETPTGEVFGSFTSSPWRNHFGFYGSAPAFVWKMRHSRRTKCYSLFDQAQLESEIDVYMYTGSNELVQACRHDELAVGGDDSLPNVVEAESCSKLPEPPDTATRDLSAGFAIALNEDLMAGTSSPSGTFGNPSLSGSKDGYFEVSNLEVWTLSPAFDVKSAERLEMTKFFIHESIRGTRSSTRSELSDRSSASSAFSSRDLVQEQFYRRVGHDPEASERRERWQRTNMMDGTDSAPRGMGASPRF
jgi:hypothetical protein